MVVDGALAYAFVPPSSSFLIRCDPGADSAEGVERNFQVADAIVLCRRQVARAHIDLNRRENQARHIQRGITGFAHADKGVFAGAFMDMNVVFALFGHRRFPDKLLSSTGR